MSAPSFRLVCVDCGAPYPGFELRYRCGCGGTLDVVHDLPTLRDRVGFELFDRRLASKARHDRSGVWRFRELILPVAEGEIVTKPEGNTNLYRSEALAAWVGIDDVAWKHEGENPTGSFKDRGMTVGITVAKKLGMNRVACASTGNTSASMASYAAAAGMTAYVFIPEGKVAFGKLSQALAYGATTIQIEGDFDAAMRLVQEACAARGVYLLNSINPFRIEGQKAIAFELLQDLQWAVPDWIVVPGGNLGNSAALGKGFAELFELGLIPRLPKLAVIQAQGANPFATAFRSGRPVVPLPAAETRATAIRSTRASSNRSRACSKREPIGWMEARSAEPGTCAALGDGASRRITVPASEPMVEDETIVTRARAAPTCRARCAIPRRLSVSPDPDPTTSRSTAWMDGVVGSPTT